MFSSLLHFQPVPSFSFRWAIPTRFSLFSFIFFHHPKFGFLDYMLYVTMRVRTYVRACVRVCVCVYVRVCAA